MRDDFKAIVQAAIMLAVGKFFSLIGSAQDLASVFAAFACFVHFKLYTEIAAAAAKEDGGGFVAVFVDVAITLHLVKAAPAVGVLLAIVLIFIVGGAGGYTTAAACAGGVEGLPAGWTE